MRPCFVRLAGRSALAVPMLLGALTAAHGQLITPRTVPVHQDEQFAIFPSTRASMGGVSIALDDSLADPFVNPARAAMIRHASTFAAPFDHAISGGHGGGRTLSLGGTDSRGEWATAFVLAAQNLDHRSNSNPLNLGWLNRYGQLSVARRLDNDLSIGASAYMARINAMDGFDILYSGSDAVAQVGSLADFRLGATKHWGERTLDLLLLNTRTDITHTVEWNWNQFNDGGPGLEYKHEVDRNFDRTNVWGAHARFVQPLDDGWQFGWTATANRMTHPKIPDYDIEHVAFVWRDPGTTNAYNFGLGVSRTVGLTTFGLDFIQEPMTSHTWGEAADGSHSIDNSFKFSNSHVRMGASQDVPLLPNRSAMFGVRMGLDVYNVNYDLHQDDHVAGRVRNSTEGWHDLTGTFGLHLLLKGADVIYTYRTTCSGNCISLGMGDKVEVAGPMVGTIAAPLEPVNVDPGRSRFHQLTVVVPLR